MSTKIYNGYRFKKNYDIRTLQRVCLRLSNKITPIAYKEYLKKYYSLYFKVIDFNEFGLYDEVMYFIGKKGQYVDIQIEKYISTRIKHFNLKNSRDPLYDFDFSFSIIPIKRKVLLLLWTENNSIIKEFENYPQILDYHYQNQSDRPEDISNRGWEQRRKDWNEALGGDGYARPNQVGFLYKPYESNSFNDIHSLYGLTDDDVELLFPTMEMRIKSIAKELHYQDFVKNNPIDPSITDKEEQLNLYNKLYWKYQVYLETEQGIHDRNVLNKEIKAKLQKINSLKELRDEKYRNIVFHEKILDILKNKKKPYWLE